jgi:uncharacterized protein YukE
MGDWIDDRLHDLENWIYQGHDIPSDHSVTHVLFCDIPPLSQMVADARHIYEFAVMHIPDTDLLNAMAGTLAAIRDEAEKHATELNNSLDPLAAAWQGPAAEAYYAPPGFHADQITPGGTAYTLIQNLRTVNQGSATNHQSHATMVSKFNDMHGNQTNLYVSLGGVVIGMGATVALGGVDFEVTGPGMAADVAWGVRVVQTIQGLIPAIEIAVDIRTIAGIAGVVLVTLTLLTIAGDSAVTTTTVATTGTWVMPDGTTLPKEFQKMAKELWYYYQGKLAWLTRVMVAYLACHYSKEFIQALLNLALAVASGEVVWQGTETIEDLLNAVVANDPGALNVLHAIMTVGPQNISGLSLRFNEVINGIRYEGDVDIVASNPSRYIEVGGPSKGWPTKQAETLRQWQKEVLYAQAHGAIAQVYLQQPTPPVDPFDQTAYNWALQTANSIFDPENVVQMPPLGC